MYRSISKMNLIKFFLCVVASMGWLLFFACKSKNPYNYENITIRQFNINVPYMQTAFYNTHKVSTRTDKRYFYVYSNGMAFNYHMMQGITDWSQAVPIPQFYTEANAWRIPKTVTIAKESLPLKDNFRDSPIAIAIDGVPIYNPYNINGLDISNTGMLDKWGGHAGETDDYHYHLAPLHLQTVSNNGPIAYAFDGIPIYGDKERNGEEIEFLDKNSGHEDAIDGYHYHRTRENHHPFTRMVGVVKIDKNSEAPLNRIADMPTPQKIREPLIPIDDVIIESFEKIGANSFKLSYKITTEPPDKNGYYNFYDLIYSWNADRTVYTFQYFKNTFIMKTQTYINYSNDK